MLLEPRQQIEKLVAKYQSLSQRERRDYNEANTKNVFVQPLFAALDWNFSDINQVEAEKTIVKGRVDYVFKINRVSKFCLEVKPLRDELTDDHRKQAISYAYNKGVTWAALTNFDRLQVFNAERKTPDLNSVLSLNLSHEDYVSYFDDLRLLSRDSVAGNALDKVAERYGRLALRIPIEKRLYQHLRESREKLFNEIYLFHKDRAITLETTDRLIQELFHRLLFIRTAEDRDLAGNHPLLATLHQWQQDKGQELIEHLRHVFREFAQLYDSDLFPSIMDSWEQISVNSYLLADTIGGLYDVPGDFARYDFAAIDADVLGQVYEQYLGYIAHVAREEAKRQLRLLPEAERIEITAKREKRKAAGIYYTPKWVTDYIVRQTVGRFIEEHDHNEILNVKILDPACGSGSFLIRAYDELLSYHAQVKSKSVADLDWMERMEVLTRNIFGVDLDPQAVEIARLSLLIRALAERRSLPPLTNNIQCGNSLISGSDEELQQCLGENFRDKRPFNWEERYPDIMKQGGFDIVIGNPPYVRPHKLETSDKKALWAQYQVYRAKSDIYACFIQRAIDLLKPGGYASYIVSNTFMSLESFAPLRNYILDTCYILYFGLTPKKVFEAATVETIMLGLKKESNEAARQQNKVWITEYRDGTFERVKEIPQGIFYSTYLNIFDLSWDEATLSLSSKIELNTDKLSDAVSFCYGLKTGDDAVFLTYAPTTPEHKRLLRRSDFGRFSTEYKGEFVWYVPEQMKKHRTTARPGNHERFERPKILVQDIGKRLIGTLDDDHFYVKDALMLHQRENGLDLKFVLALINSKLLNYWYAQKFSTLSVAKNAILMLPIRRIDFDNATEKKIHDDLVALANKLLELNEELAENKEKGEDIFGDKRRQLEAEIDKTSQRIDELVYQLYGITDEERKIIEASL